MKLRWLLRDVPVPDTFKVTFRLSFPDRPGSVPFKHTVKGIEAETEKEAETKARKVVKKVFPRCHLYLKAVRPDDGARKYNLRGWAKSTRKAKARQARLRARRS